MSREGRGPRGASEERAAPPERQLRRGTHAAVWQGAVLEGALGEGGGRPGGGEMREEGGRPGEKCTE